MPTAVQAALDEITAGLTALAPEHEGLRDLARLNLLPETMTEVRISLDQYERRVRYLTAVRAPLEQLVADGHPDLAPRQISDAALADIQANLDTIAAARRQFISNVATRLNLSAGAVEPK